MIDLIIEYFKLDLTDALVTIIPVSMSLVVSLVMGLIIYSVYLRVFQGVVFNLGFAKSLAAMTILTSMVTLAISSNIALSLGMVGALSIVRYRAAIKDPMDLMFLFWAVSTGIAVGANLYYMAFVGGIIVIILFLLLSRSATQKNMYILVVHYSGDDISDDLRRLLKGKRFQIKSKTIREKDIELIIELIVKRENLAFMDAINEMESTTDVTLIQYSGDIH